MDQSLAGGRASSYFHRIEGALRLLGHRGNSWIPAILIALGAEPLRYTELLEQINDLEARWQGRPLSEKVLSEVLRRMVRDGLVLRHRAKRYPQSTSYELTEPARSLLVALRPLAQWWSHSYYPQGTPAVVPGDGAAG